MMNLNFKVHSISMFSIIAIMNIALAACSQNESPHIEHINQIQESHTPESSNSLTNVAGKARPPVQENADTTPQSVAKEWQKFVGRYQTTMQCDDGFARCDKGEAEFIINLLADGTAHRIFMHRGKVEFTTQRQYRQDRWLYDPHHHQIIILRESGVQFFYNLDEQGNMVMDLDKIANATQVNQTFFKDNPLPSRAYTLQRQKL